MSAGAVAYGRALLDRIAALCEADPSREVCGLVVRAGGELRIEPVPNAADRHHAADPAAFPRTSRESYLMDLEAQLRVLRALDEEGGEVVAVWHSHVEVGAYLSAKDRADALLDGVPVFAGAEYLVFGVRAGKVTERRRFRLEGGEFLESELA